MRVAVKAVSTPNGVNGIWSTKIIIDMLGGTSGTDVCDSKAVALLMNTAELRVARQVDTAPPPRARRVASRPVIYFSDKSFDFGHCDVGEEREERVKLCNRGKSETVVCLQIPEGDPAFSLRHRRVRIRARSFVLIPIRFHPTRSSVSEQVLECTSAVGASTVLLRGTGTGESV